MKLFIWTNFAPNWSGGLAFAVAKNEAQARELIIKEHGFNPMYWGNLEVMRLNLPVARAVSGGA